MHATKSDIEDSQLILIKDRTAQNSLVVYVTNEARHGSPDFSLSENWHGLS